MYTSQLFLSVEFTHIVVWPVFVILFHLVIVGFCAPSMLTPLCPSPSPWPPSFCGLSLSIYYSRYFIQAESHSICLCVTGLFHLAQCPQGAARDGSSSVFKAESYSTVCICGWTTMTPFCQLHLGPVARPPLPFQHDWMFPGGASL